ncbi:MAG: tryptophan 2,3-dioxygenase family protein [Saprospiraceae bacterium]
MDITPEIKAKLEALQSKYDVMGQDMLAYLDGLIHANYVDYWDYIHLDTLLSLQQPRTPIPDERIFIIYHQITELYFKLCVQAIEQVQEQENLTVDFLKRQLKRLISYFESLVRSFEVMIDGMDKNEFLQFRMALLPASGFQSVQFRIIEFMSTDGNNLVHADARDQYTHNSEPSNYWSELYWKRGGLEKKTGKKTLTLRRFEKKYAKKLQELAADQLSINLNRLYRPWAEDKELVTMLRRFDQLATVDWPMAHMTSASRYLDKKPEVIEATGGTNWQEYLPPRFRRVTFFPDLWTKEELETWGRAKRGGDTGGKCPGMH